MQLPSYSSRHQSESFKVTEIGAQPGEDNSELLYAGVK